MVNQAIALWCGTESAYITKSEDSLLSRVLGKKMVLQVANVCFLSSISFTYSGLLNSSKVLHAFSSQVVLREGEETVIFFPSEYLFSA